MMLRNIKQIRLDRIKDRLNSTAFKQINEKSTERRAVKQIWADCMTDALWIKSHLEQIHNPNPDVWLSHSEQDSKYYEVMESYKEKAMKIVRLDKNKRAYYNGLYNQMAIENAIHDIMRDNYLLL